MYVASASAKSAAGHAARELLTSRVRVAGSHRPASHEAKASTVPLSQNRRDARIARYACGPVHSYEVYSASVTSIPLDAAHPVHAAPARALIPTKAPPGASGSDA